MIYFSITITQHFTCSSSTSYCPYTIYTKRLNDYSTDSPHCTIYIYIKKNNFIQPTATQREGKTTRYSHYIQA